MDISTLQEQIQTCGLTRIQSLIPHDLIDHFIVDVHLLRLKMGDTFSTDLSGRITYIHREIPRALEILLSDQIGPILKALMNDNPVLCQSIVYRLGSEYADHFDRYFYPTSQIKKEFTVWVALEDVHPNSGPFYFVPGSHHWPEMTGERLHKKYPDWYKTSNEVFQQNSNVSRKNEVISQGMHLVAQEFSYQIAKIAGSRVPVLLKKGDVVIWQSSLVHGGLRRFDVNCTRQCLIGNYFAESSNVWTTQQFFQLKEHEFTKKNSRKIDYLPFGSGHYFFDGEPTLGQ